MIMLSWLSKVVLVATAILVVASWIMSHQIDEEHRHRGW